MVKNIIFDFGGVIYDINFNNTFEKLKESGVKDVEKVSLEFTERHLFERFETGAITKEEFRNEVRDVSDLQVNDDKIDEIWNALLIGFKPERVHLIEKVKLNYNIFLLSNSNIIHYEQYRSEFEQQFGYKTFDDLFKKAYFSFEMGLNKPDKTIFQKVIQEQNIESQETLFIDDTEMHTKSAAQAGLLVRYLRLEHREDMINMFDHTGMLKQQQFS
ncbi:MAG: HAD family phosphatase [Bacteroidales bacterium]|nr:HAD family phosphatase [Bacteroidales bacterium]